MENENWIRRKILDKIIDTINSKGTTDIFYITGSGGQGKTVLLRQVGYFMKSEDGIKPSHLYSGILDLYHSDVNTNSGLETRLITALERSEEFKAYHTARKRYQARRIEGVGEAELESAREKMGKLFGEGINKVSQWQRPVIAIDTTERIQYEVDEVQRKCDFEGNPTLVREWLLEQLSQWKNCVVLLAGRPEDPPYLQLALEEEFSSNIGVNYHRYDLGGFDESEAGEYFNKAREKNTDIREALDKVFCNKLWEVTERLPIRLDLSIEIVKRGWEFEKFQQQVMTGKPSEIRKEIDKLLVQYVFEGEQDKQVKTILRYLAMCRKGLNGALLCYLAQTGDAESWQKELDKLNDRFYIKRHPEDDLTYLHDALYKFLDEHWLRADEVQTYSKKIVEWYDRKIESAGKDSTKRQDHQVNSLLYRLRTDPVKGYQQYMMWAEPAIRANQVGFDLRLHTEMIAFLQSDSPIDERILQSGGSLKAEFIADSAANWVKRFNVRGQNDDAILIAEKILNQHPELLATGQAGNYARADLDVYYAQALIYSSRVDEAVDILNKLIDRLQSEKTSEQLAAEEADTYRGWRRNLILGRAHNNLGYANWHYLSHLNHAIVEFRSALPFFRATQLLQEELANTDDNIGRVYSTLRHQTRAEALVDESLALREKLGRQFRLALSQVSRAAVHNEFDEPSRARLISLKAWNTFRNLEAKRGEGLAATVLGHSYRELSKLRSSGLYDLDECENFLSEAKTLLEEAVTIFRGSVKEPLRLVEGLNELGCIIREKARLEFEKNPDSSIGEVICEDAIEKLTEALVLAGEYKLPVAEVDSCEDIAQVYLILKDYDNVSEWLNKAEQKVPPEYKLSGKRGFISLTDEVAVEEYWAMLGKIELLRGNMTFDMEYSKLDGKITWDSLADCMCHYALATAYFVRFSDRAIGIGSTFRQMHDRVKRTAFEDQIRIPKELTRIEKQYNIKVDRLKNFFQDTTGLVTPPSR
jgi:hypothetical protein